MNSREIAIKISELIQYLQDVLPEKAALEAFREKLYIQIGQSASSVTLKDLLRKQELDYNAKVGRINHELRSLELMQTFMQDSSYPPFERIVIGAGVAGSAVFAEMPTQLRYAMHGKFPAVLVLSDPDTSHQWPQDGSSLMGQPAAIQTPQFMSVRAEDLCLDEHSDPQRNPYNYTLSNHFTSALMQTQNDLNMRILNIKALRIESRNFMSTSTATTLPAWGNYNFPHRVIIAIDGHEYALYTKAIDLCVGPGSTQRLSNEQVLPTLSQKLIAENKLIYGQYDGDADLVGDVVFYGGGARAATMALDIALGAKPNAKLKYWVSRKGSDFRDTGKLSRMYNDIYQMHDAVAPKRANTLTGVNQLSDGRLKLHFTAPREQQSDHQMPEIKDEDVVCDQLVVAIGQQPHPLTDNLSGFVPTLYKNDKVTNIPLGTRSSDGTLVVWGAAGSTGIGLSPSERLAYLDSTRAHGYTLPPESQAAPSIFRSTWTIQQQAKQLKKLGFFPRVVEKTAGEYDIDDLAFSNINLATLSDLKKYATDEMAARIIAFRAKTILGIQTLKQLAAAIPAIPVETLIHLKGNYFPLAISDDLPSSLHRQTIIVSNTTALPSTEGLFGTTRRREELDSFAFISTAANTNTTENSNVTNDRVLLTPSIRVNSG
jgi:hypothetical protein